MTGPDDARPPDPPTGWEETRQNVQELWATAPDPVTPPPAEPPTAELPTTDPAQFVAPVTQEPENPMVSREVEAADEAPTGEGLPDLTLPAQAVTPQAEAPPTAQTVAPDAAAQVGPAALPTGFAPEPQPREQATGTALPTTPPEPVAAQADPASPLPTDELEELTYAPTLSPQGPQPGDEVDGYYLNADLGRGWFTATPVGSGPSADVYVRPEPLWAQLRAHRSLPRHSRVGALTVLEPTGGAPLKLPLGAAEARAAAAELARLLFALEKQGYAVTDLDPDSPQGTPDGLKLRFPPRVARLGEVPEATLRDGYTPPEVQAAAPADVRSGVYLLGALLYRWLTGQALPPEGPSPLVLAGVGASGMPQLLSALLAPLPDRPTPQEVLGLLRAASARLPMYAVAAVTDIGLNPERPANEDSYGFVWRQLDGHSLDGSGGELSLRACVADGMGGMAAGEVASQAAVRGFLNSAAPGLEAQVWDANAAVLADMAGRDGGCTLSAVELTGTALKLGHVGDTRAYLAADGAVTQLSKDHSYVAAMVASGQMTPEEAQTSPERNKVLRSLGSLRTPQEGYVFAPEPLELAVGSRVLLVSDGVWGEVEWPVLSDVLLREPTPQAVAERLIALSLEAGAPDNATALVIERLR